MNSALQPELPSPGLRRENFRCIAQGGFGDAENSYPHSMAWYRGQVYVGTTRSNLCMMRLFQAEKYPVLDGVWPVECPEDIYTMDRRAQIWAYDPDAARWQERYRSPMATGMNDENMAREIGYRAMCVFQGASDPEPMLYAATTSPGRGQGALILRSQDGHHFDPVSDYGIIGLPITSIRTLVTFRGRLYTAPTGTRGGNVNTGMIPVVYASSDPAHGVWEAVSSPGFGDEGNSTVFELAPCGDYLYAGTFNLKGFQIWRTQAEGPAPFRWECVLRDGGGRGALNQCTASLFAFKGLLYVGSGIQGGGYDQENKIGPAAAELLRIHPDGHWDLVVGSTRDLSDGREIRPLSGFDAGFGHLLNGYFWRMGEHNGWLYLGTYDATIMLRWMSMSHATDLTRQFLERVDRERYIGHHGGCDLWRSFDGENWLPVDHQGFGSAYNVGLRTFLSTPRGLFIGTANPFGPKVAEYHHGKWDYAPNPRGGLEIWHGC